MASANGDKSASSISKLRNVIFACLVVGVTIYTAAMFSIAARLSDSFGPQVRADLQWKVLRGAQELARTSDLGLAVGDATMVQEAFGVYATSEDVQAIVAADNDLKVIATHGEPPESPARLFAGEPGSMREEGAYLVSWANAQIEGAPVGKVAVVVSTRRLANAQALLDKSSHIALGGGLAGLGLGFIVVTFFTRAVAQRDARLSDYAGNLERKVEERTRELDAVNAGMRLVLDNVAQGFITVSVDGVMAPERSAIVDRWFGAPSSDGMFSSYVKSLAPQYGTWFDMGLEQLRDDVLPVELVLDQMPARFTANGKTFDATYTPIHEAGKVVRLLVIISDVTELLARELAEREQRELVGLFQRISVDRNGVEEFLTEAAGMVSDLRSESDPVVQQRLVHTLKGNCAMYGLESYAVLAHNVETDLVEHQRGLDDEQRASLVRVWKEAMQRMGKLLGGQRRDVVELDRGELESVLARAQNGVSSPELVSVFAEWFREPVDRRLKRLARQASAVARRLGKPEPHVEIVSHGIRLDPDGWSTYWTSMVHVVRNAMDHGIEDAEARLLAGKSEAGRLEIGARRDEGRLIISVRDDGAGIDWERLRQKAMQAGIPSTTHEDLTEALFADGLSTKEQTSDISGRGVGLAALRQVVRDLGGSIEVESVFGHGTAFHFSFEERSVVLAAANAPRVARTSLMPNFG